jgi:hypothetical protein
LVCDPRGREAALARELSALREDVVFIVPPFWTCIFLRNKHQYGLRLAPIQAGATDACRVFDGLALSDQPMGHMCPIGSR